MGTQSIVKFLIGFLIVAMLVLAWSAIQGLGAGFGDHVQEWLR